MPQPSGQQFEIRLGDQRAVVVEVGGGLRSYEAGGTPVLDGYGADEMSRSGRGQVLLPWPNRLEDGSYEFGGQQYQLPINEVATRDAIHGLVRWANWTVREHDEARVVMTHRLHPQPGYPFMLDIEIDYRLSDEGLSVTTTATNAGDGPCPYGAGAHPYLTLGTESVDALVLRAPAGTVLIENDRGIPIGREAVDGTEYDFRRPREIGDVVLDHCFTDLERDADGRARVRLAQRTLWVDEAYGFLMLFTGDPLPDVSRRSVAMEPMTCPPNALRTGEALAVLDPGGSHTGHWGIVPAGE
jgi:aldose 1-epimerase